MPRLRVRLMYRSMQHHRDGQIVSIEDKPVLPFQPVVGFEEVSAWLVGGAAREAESKDISRVISVDALDNFVVQLGGER